MANIKSAKKRAKTNEVCRLRNVSRRSDMKSTSKSVLEALEQKDVALAQKLLRSAESKIARACGKNVVKRNTARRKISRLARRVALASQTTTS